MAWHLWSRWFVGCWLCGGVEQITNAKTDKAEYQREADNIRRRRTRLGLEVQRLRDAVDADASAATDNKEELVALERQIEEANARLDDEVRDMIRSYWRWITQLTRLDVTHLCCGTS